MLARPLFLAQETNKQVFGYQLQYCYPQTHSPNKYLGNKHTIIHFDKYLIWKSFKERVSPLALEKSYLLSMKAEAQHAETLWVELELSFWNAFNL